MEFSAAVGSAISTRVRGTMRRSRMSVVQGTVFTIAAFCVLCTNALWYRAKFLLRGRGFPVSFFSDHLQDLRHLSQLAESETDLVRRAEIRRLRAAILGFLVASLIFFACFALASTRGGK